MTKKLKIAFQGEPGSQFPHRHRRGLSRRRAVALPDLRGRAGCDHLGGGRPRHDPDRELGRRPRRRHSSSAAAIRPVHRRRIFLADPSPDDGAARRQARRHQDRGEPRPRARAMPQHHPQAQDQADRLGRYRGQRPPRRRTRRQEPAPRSPRSSRPISTDSIFWRKTSRTRPTTPRASWCWRAKRPGPSRDRGRWSPLLCSGCATCRPRSTRRWAVCHQRRQHDQTGKLHGRRQFLRHAILCRRRRPSRGQEAWRSRWRN